MVLENRFCVNRRCWGRERGDVGERYLWVTAYDGCCAWLQEKPWLALRGPFLLCMNDLRNHFCRDSISGTVSSYQSGQVLAGRDPIYSESLLMSAIIHWSGRAMKNMEDLIHHVNGMK